LEQKHLSPCVINGLVRNELPGATGKVGEARVDE
jgi:hypothetical protein